MTLKIDKITILKNSRGCDRIYLHLPIVEGTWPYKANATAQIDVASLGGEDYVKKNFSDIEYEVIAIG